VVQGVPVSYTTNQPSFAFVIEVTSHNSDIVTLTVVFANLSADTSVGQISQAGICIQNIISSTI
jgi:hypothetical protein